MPGRSRASIMLCVSLPLVAGLAWSVVSRHPTRSGTPMRSEPSSAVVHREGGTSTRRTFSATPTVGLTDSLLPPSSRALFDSVWAHLSSLTPRSEFESSAAYKARVAPLLKGTFAFRVDCTKAYTNYDPDRQSFTITFLPTSADHQAIDVTCQSGNVGSFNGENAFGVHRIVTEQVTYEAAVRAASRFAPLGAIRRSWTVRPEVARGQAEQLAFYLIVRPSSDPSFPLTSSPSTVEDATLDLPVRRAFLAHVVTADLIDLWVVDEQSGSIIRKFDLFARHR